MWLIDTKTLRLKFFANTDGIEYAILSHTWGDEEVNFQEIQSLSDNEIKDKSAWVKIQETCKIALRDHGLKFAWIDTCCIDKSSSAELSDAINSMFQWYRRSQVCYVFLFDVPPESDPTEDDSAFQTCRWFTRGWTLQELLAPGTLVFYNSEWEPIGDRTSMATQIHRRTSIPIEYLTDADFQKASVAQRMSWASDRSVTREEDIAYSLLGLFDVNMPLLYGEGERKAFLRLQEEIMKTSADDSLLAWMSPEDGSSRPNPRPGFGFGRLVDIKASPNCYATKKLVHDDAGPFAPSPKAFNHCRRMNMHVLGDPMRLHWENSNHGLRLNLPIYKEHGQSDVFGLLNFGIDRNVNDVFAVRLRRTYQEGEFVRCGLERLGWSEIKAARLASICILYVKDLNTSENLGLNWYHLYPTIVKTTPTLKDYIVSNLHLMNHGGQRVVDDKRLWQPLRYVEWIGTGINLKLSSQCSGEPVNYVLILYRKSLWNILFSGTFLTSLAAGYLARFPPDGDLGNLLKSFKPSARHRRLCEGLLERAIKEEVLEFQGHHYNLVEISGPLDPEIRQLDRLIQRFNLAIDFIAPLVSRAIISVLLLLAGMLIVRNCPDPRKCPPNIVYGAFGYLEHTLSWPASEHALSYMFLKAQSSKRVILRAISSHIAKLPVTPGPALALPAVVLSVLMARFLQFHLPLLAAILPFLHIKLICALVSIHRPERTAFYRAMLQRWDFGHLAVWSSIIVFSFAPVRIAIYGKGVHLFAGTGMDRPEL